MKLIRRAFLILALVAIPTSVLISHQAYGGVMLPPPAGFPTGPACQSLDDCPIGFGDCGPDPGGGSDLVCLPMFCSFDSDCISNQCDIGVCALPEPIEPISNAIVVSANDPDTGACEIGEVHPETGVYSKMFDAGCSECGGIDQDQNGNFLVACGAEPAPEVAGISKRGLLTGAILELEPLRGRQISANIHGRSNYISDIAILPDRSVLSHETLDEDMVHKHKRGNRFIAEPLGTSGLDVENAGLAAPVNRNYRTLAANLDGVPALYDIDPDTGEAMLNIALQLPPEVVIASAESATRAVALKDIQIQAIDALDPIAVINTGPISASVDLGTRAGLFPIEDTDYVVLLTKDDPDPMSGSEDGWAAIALIDHETGQVDHIVEIRSDEELLFTGLTLKRPVPSNVPTLSEWGLIVTAGVLGFVGLLAIRRRKAFV